MRIAIIGSGIAGLVCAFLLRPRFEVTVYEASDRVGGHTHTVKTPHGSWVDTGFIVFNCENYPCFTRLLQELGVSYQPTQMSFSASCEASGLEYSTASLYHLFAQRRNLLNPAFYSLLRGILRFNRQVGKQGEGLADDMTVQEFVQQQRYSRHFVKYFLHPIGTALWSCPQSKFEAFPMRFIMEFYRHHGMHQVFHQPGWHVVQGGSHRYVEKLISPFQRNIRTSCRVERVIREEEKVIIHAQGRRADYDEVIFACHSNQALQLLGEGIRPVERELLGMFPYSKNQVTLHTDTAVLPRSRRAWAAWNARIGRTHEAESRVTYNMNILQSIRADNTYCVSLNQDNEIADQHVIKRMVYEHPLFHAMRGTAQSRHGELIRQARTSFCGAYWGNGFHEAGVVSALRVCRAFGELPSWTTVGA